MSDGPTVSHSIILLHLNKTCGMVVRMRSGIGRRSTTRQWTRHLARPREFDNDKALDARLSASGVMARGNVVRDLAAEMVSTAQAFTMPSVTSTRFLRKRSSDMRSARCGPLFSVWRAGALPEMPSGSFPRADRKLSQGSGSRGCFIVNSALEVAPHDAELGKVIASYLEEIKAFFQRLLSVARCW